MARRALLVSSLPFACGLHLASNRTYAPDMLIEDDEERAGPHTAVLLVGLMRGMDANNWVSMINEKVIKPHNADLYVHTTESARKELDDVRREFADSLVVAVNQPQPNAPHGDSDYQFWHVSEAFKLMEKHEADRGRYQVVIKLRTDVSPWGSAALNLAGWQQQGFIHMMTDWMYWGQRNDMQEVVKFYDNINSYFQAKYPAPLGRPIDVQAMLETIRRDPRMKAEKYLPVGNPAAQEIEDWHSYNKIETLPYPDEGKVGALANLQAASSKGLTQCLDGHGCTTRCGDRYYNDHDGRACDGGGDYEHGQIRCEKDLLGWVQAQGLVICDIGKAMNAVNFKGLVESRRLASDC